MNFVGFIINFIKKFFIRSAFVSNRLSPLMEFIGSLAIALSIYIGGVFVLNETMLNESSSLALSIYSPENLASLLEDKEVLTREQKIAFARKQMQQSVN